MHRFDAAPWSLTVKLASAVACAVLVAIAVTFLVAAPREVRVSEGGLIRALLVVLPLVVLGGSLLFVVRTYELAEGGLRVRRLLWTTDVPIAGLDRAWHDPKAMRRSTRIFGNGGLFAIAGWFYSRTLGRYRAFVTNPHRAVVMRTHSGTVVVSPDDPARFIETLHALHPSAAIGKP
jgi:hypothetical protein